MFCKNRRLKVVGGWWLVVASTKQYILLIEANHLIGGVVSRIFAIDEVRVDLMQAIETVRQSAPGSS